MDVQAGTELLLADRIWIAVALLHSESPEREDFSTEEIRSKLRETGLSMGTKPSSVAAHLKQHLVANVPSSSTPYRMLFETMPGRLRLFRPGDYTDPSRTHRQRLSKHMPKREEVPPHHHPLLDWYEEWSKSSAVSEPKKWEDDPLIRLIGSGKHIWADEHADDYVNRLREENA
jgi:hypothetical protein